MNKIYRLIWSKKSNSLVAVSEAAKTKRQGTSSSTSKLVGAVAAALLSLSANSPKAAILNYTSSGVNNALVGSVSQAGLNQFDISGFANFTNNGRIVFTDQGLVNSGSSSNLSTNIVNNGITNGEGIITSTIGIYIQGIANVQGEGGPILPTVTWRPGLAGNITNNGVISGASADILVEAGTVGHIVNSSSGVLSTEDNGIFVKAGSVAGFYTPSSSSVPWSAAKSSTVASISNYGEIFAINGIRVSESTISGGIQNIGNYSITNSIAGIGNRRIHGAGNGIQLDSAKIDSGGITNSGFISMSGGDGIHAVNSTISGGIHNIGVYSDGTIVGTQAPGSLVGALIEGINGIYLNNVKLTSGGITNSGFINGNVSSGLQIYNSQIVSGNISNSGTIFGAVSGMSMWGTSSLSGSILNSGLIMAYNASHDDRTYGSAIQIRDSTTTISGDIINLAGGRMIARENNDHGININEAEVDGSIINHGTILAFINHGINIESSNWVGGILNTGTIASYGGDPDLILADGGTKTGTFTGDGQGIYIYSSNIGSIVNSGSAALIVGHNTGLRLTNTTMLDIGASISNSGTIAGVTGAGIKMDASALDGSLVNSGTILGGTYGLEVENSSIYSNISNSGLILGASGDGIYLSDSTITGVIRNSGPILGFNNSGIIGFDNGISAINTEITQNISNTGLIRGVLGDGMYLASGSSVTGNINNFGTIVGSGYGIYASDSSITGGISNSGLIQGTTASGIYLRSLLQDTSIGNITNTSPGIIQGRDTGIKAVGTINNGGMFFGVTVGDITNRGSISPSGTNSSAAIDIEGATVGHILNDTGGTLSGDDFGIRARGIYKFGSPSYQHTSSIASITNNGLISISNSDINSNYPVGIMIEAPGLASNVSIAGNIINSGTISMSNSDLAYGIYNVYGDIGGDIKNSGTNSLITISGNGYGILNAGSTVHGSIINEGSIIVNSSAYGAGIYNAASIAGGITNTGRIDGGTYGVRVQSNLSNNTINNIFNSGYVSGLTSALSINSYAGYYNLSQSIGLIENQTGGTLSGGSSGIFIGDSYYTAAGSSYTYLGNTYYLMPAANVDNIINRGTISAQSINGYAINNAGGTIGGITNTGLIIGGASGTGIINQGSIGTLLNTGRITAASGPHVDIYNEAGVNVRGQTIGIIDRLINAQGGSSPNTALSFAGRLPTAYEIIVTSTSSYGQLAVTTSSGSMLFAGINATYSASRLTGNHTYEDVITGVGSSYLTGSLSGTYNSRYPWQLLEDETSLGNWNLVLGAPSGPGAIETQASLRQVANALKSPFVTQNIALNNALNYDCNLFDQRGMCVSLGGAYSQAAGSNTQASSGVVVLGYQFNNQFRVGGYLDQQLHSKSSTIVSMSNSNPMMGVFAVWNKNANLQGAQIKWSSGYTHHDLSVTRPIVDDASEPGSGNTQIKAWGTSLIGSYMVPINDRLSASPYIGMRYSRIKTNGYSETLNNDTVTAPLTFADLTQKSTTALLGAKLQTQLNDRLNILASLGLEHDMSYKGGRYLGTGDVETSSIDFNPNSNHTRMNASLGAYFDVTKKHRIGANIFWSEQPFTDKNSTSLFVNYTIGL